jgi:ATP-dependent DNA helicase RecQ
LASGQDKGLHVYFINQTEDPGAKSQKWAQYRAVWGFVDGEGCRRVAILRHFGDRSAPVSEGRCCDACAGPLEALAAEKIAAVPKRAPAAGGDEDVRDAILRVVEEASPSVGRTRAVEILRGGRSKVVVKYAYDELPGYGDWNEWRAEELLGEVDAMLAAGVIRSTGGKFPKLEAA